MANEDKATRYHRLQRRASVFSTLAGAVLLATLLASGGAVWLRDVLRAAVGDSFTGLVAAYAVVIVLLADLVQLPFAYYQGVTLERRYGLSTQTRERWWLDRVKGMLLGQLFAVAGALALWGLLRATPDLWWLGAAALFAVVMLGLAQLGPILLMPLFYRFRPVQRPDLVERLVALAARADARVLGVYEWMLSDRTRKANAALTGIGRTRRILLSDTLLAEHSDEEIEVILAHELAHHVHHDIWKGLALEAVLMTLGFYAADRVLVVAGPGLGLANKWDIAGLPLLVLTAAAVSLVLLPLVLALSRAHERNADRYALEMTGNVTAFVSAMRRLSLANLGEDTPSRLTELLFHSHPSTSARIAAAERWAAQRQGSLG
jgi:STE24 endopeptidase